MMKTTLSYVIVAILMICTICAPTASAASEAEKTTAIQLALAHLATTQNGNGSWGAAHQSAYTGAAVFAFLSQTAKWPTPTSYTANITNGVAYLLANAVVTPASPGLSLNSAGVNICPSGSGTCQGVYWGGSGESTYNTGFVSSALVQYAQIVSGGPGSVATATGPLAGFTWLQIAQMMINAFAAGQATPSTSTAYAGGWHYNVLANSDSDMSTAQWGVISTGYAESLGAKAPAVLRTYLKNGFLVYDQLPGGNACYQLSGLCDHADTGGWLTSMAFVGNGNNAAAQNAINWLNTNWNTNWDQSWSGLFGNAYATWAVYKGLESNIGLQDNTHITAHLRTNCGGGLAGAAVTPGKTPGSGVCNWWEDLNEYLVRNQNVDGTWTETFTSWPDPLNTSLYLNILGATPLPGAITGNTTPAAIPTPALSTVALAGLGLMLVGFAAKMLRKRTV